MREEYDFSQSVANPYLSQLEEAITIKLDSQDAEYFKQLATEVGIPIQNVISLYLKDCVQAQRKPSISWTDAQSVGQT